MSRPEYWVKNPGLGLKAVRASCSSNGSAGALALQSALSRRFLPSDLYLLQSQLTNRPDDHCGDLIADMVVS